MSLLVEPPSPEQQAAGIVARFEFRDDDHAYTVRGVAKRDDRGLIISRLEVDPDGDDVSVRVLRQVPLGALLAQLRASLAPAGQVVASVESPPPCACTHRHGGRAPITADHLRKVAIAYLEETGPGKDRGAIQRMTVRFERPAGTVRTWLRMARKEGWLGPGMQGRVGAEPGPRLRVAEQQESAA